MVKSSDGDGLTGHLGVHSVRRATMRRISLPRRWLTAVPLLVLALACGNDIGLPAATIPNAVDTLLLTALNGTPIGPPSAIDLVTGTLSRPEMGDDFDFAFDIDSTGTAVLFPASQLGRGGTAAVLVSTLPFDSIERAPLEDFVTDTIMPLTVGKVLILRSRFSSILCSVFVGSLPRYAKAEVLELDTVGRTLTIQFMANLNCGYRDLMPGLPDQ